MINCTSIDKWIYHMPLTSFPTPELICFENSLNYSNFLHFSSWSSLPKVFLSPTKNFPNSCNSSHIHEGMLQMHRRPMTFHFSHAPITSHQVWLSDSAPALCVSGEGSEVQNKSSCPDESHWLPVIVNSVDLYVLTIWLYKHIPVAWHKHAAPASKVILMSRSALQSMSFTLGQALGQ